MELQWKSGSRRRESGTWNPHDIQALLEFCEWTFMPGYLGQVSSGDIHLSISRPMVEEYKRLGSEQRALPDTISSTLIRSATNY